jgi:tetratricopeptide (TPR) repeat protein
MHTVTRWVMVLGAFLVLMAGPGCTSSPRASGGGSGDSLDAGFRALERRQFDEAIARADAHLRANPRGPGAAEALYLRGRAHEERGAASQHHADRDYQTARSIYQQAMSMQPSPQLHGLLNAGMANVAYWLEDFTTAMTQWQAAYPRLEHSDAKAWTLYRIALCQQRLGQFEAADGTFAQVQQRYPGTLPAQRAGERQGSRAFAVQVGVFSTQGAADNAVAALQQQGAPVQRMTDPMGRQIIRLGPVPSYQQARTLRERHAAAYPDAFIVP